MRGTNRLGLARKLGVPFGGASVPQPVISAQDVVFLANKGIVFPKKVMEQAIAGEPILSNRKIPEWALAPQSLPKGLAKKAALAAPAPVRFSAPMQLALPAGASEAVSGVAAKVLAKAITAPIKAGRYVAAIPGRVAGSVRASISSAMAKARSVRNTAQRVRSAQRRSTKRIPR
jgi:hypothetical protein